MFSFLERRKKEEEIYKEQQSRREAFYNEQSLKNPELEAEWKRTHPPKYKPGYYISVWIVGEDGSFRSDQYYQHPNTTNYRWMYKCINTATGTIDWLDEKDLEFIEKTLRASNNLNNEQHRSSNRE